MGLLDIFSSDSETTRQRTDRRIGTTGAASPVAQPRDVGAEGQVAAGGTTQLGRGARIQISTPEGTVAKAIEAASGAARESQKTARGAVTSQRQIASRAIDKIQGQAEAAGNRGLDPMTVALIAGGSILGVILLVGFTR